MTPLDATIIGTVIFSLGSPQHGWKKADGSCLKDSNHPQLSSILHDGDHWPYGRCDATRFRLPDLRGKAAGRSTGTALIRVDP